MSHHGNETFGRILADATDGLDKQAKAMGFSGIGADQVDRGMRDFPAERQPGGGPAMMLHGLFIRRSWLTIQYPGLFKNLNIPRSRAGDGHRAVITINTAEDSKDAERLVPLACERAITWLSANGRKYLTYPIAGGQLNNFSDRLRW
jgi:hypothetical protein